MPEDRTPEETDLDAPAGRVQLGEYIIEEKIGAGGMGQVFRARQPSLDRMVALKVLPRGVASDRESVERFYREARSAAGLVHPNIVQIYTVGEEKGVPYFAMEYVIGEDLERRLKRGDRFTVEEAVGITASVAMGLACAEEAGIVHRDIKPGNIMIDSHGVVKVTDFGLAKAVKLIDSEITQAGFIVGTPSYMAPEQAEARDVDHRTDIYSLGVVFYELLCGRAPFKADDPASLIYMHVHVPADPPSGICAHIPEAVERICLKCLAKKPEERFQSATTLLSDLVRVQETVTAAVDDDEGTIVFDRRMANVLISSHLPADTLKSREKERGETPPSTEETMLMSSDEPEAPWIRRNWAAVAGGGAAAAALVVALLVAVVLGSGVGTPGAGDGPTSQGRGTGVLPAGKPVLRISKLRGILPEGTKVGVQIGEAPPYEVSELDDQAVEPGSVKLTVSRPNYKPIEHVFEMVVGKEPELTEEMFRLEPDEAFAKLIEEARSLIEDKKFSAAETTVDKIGLKDPSAPFLGEIKSRLAEAKAAWNDHWSAIFDEAKGLLGDGKAEEAGKLLARIPDRHHAYPSAQAKLKKIAETGALIRESRAKMEARVGEGKFGQARATYESLVEAHKIPPDELEGLSGLVERFRKGERLVKEADEARKAGHQGIAIEKYKELAELAPRSVLFSDSVRELDEMIGRMGRIKKLVTSAEGYMARKEFDNAFSVLEKLRRDDPAEARKLEQRLGTQRAEHELAGFLALLDGALAALDAEALARLVDPDNAALAGRARESMKAFAECSMKFEKTSRHSLEGFNLRPDGAEARVKWDFTVDVPSAGRKIAGSEDMRFLFRKRAEGWRLARVEAGGRARARLLGGGAGGEDKTEKRIQGRVKKVEGTIVTIDRGSAHGVKVKMIFTLYRDARVVRVPLVADKVIVVEEEKVGEWRVIEVRREESLAAYVGDPAGMKRPDNTMLAVASPLKSVAAAPPVIRHISADRNMAAMGRAIKVEIDVVNVDGVPVVYVWEADGGRLNPQRTTVPRTAWTAPQRLGEYTVRVRAVSPLGSSSAIETKLRSEGAPRGPGGPRVRKLVSASEIPIAAPFGVAGDLTFDEANRAYVLDKKSSELLVFSPEFRLLSTSRSYRGKPLRIRTARGHVYVLESRAVKRYALGKDTFASPAGASYGKPGKGNGTFSQPVDFALSPDGEVAVLDAGSCTVQVFGTHGRFVASFGAKGRAGGELLEPKAIVSAPARASGAGSHAFFVLDGGRRQVLVFSRGGYAGEFPVGSPKGELTDLAYDPVGDRLLVLDGERCEVLVYTTGGVKLGTPAVRERKSSGKAKSLPLGELSSPSRIVCDGASYMYVLGGDKSQTIDRFDLPQEADATAKFAGRMSSVAPTTFTRLAASAHGTLYLADEKTGLLWQVGSGAWLTGRLGGPGVTPAWSKAVDVAADASGDFYVLDVSTVHRFSSKLVRKKRFGKKDKAGVRDGLDNTVAIAGSPAGAAASAGAPWSPSEYVAVLLRARQFGVHLFLPEGTAQAPFPDKERPRQASSVAIGAGGMVHVGSEGLLESFGTDGSVRHVTKLPLSHPLRLAASADGTVYALEAGRRPKLVGVRPALGKVTVRFDVPKTIRSPGDIACDGYGSVYLLEGKARKIHVLRPAAAAGP